MIEIADDNHIFEECIPFTKSDMKFDCPFETINEFMDSIDCGAFSYDESGVYCCQHDGVWYKSKKHINLKESAPKWATHVMWWGK